MIWNMVKIVPSFRQRKALMMTSASYWTWAMPWLAAPLRTDSPYLIRNDTPR